MTGNILIEEKIGHILREKRKTLALAESCTGGLASHRITSVAGSSDYFRGGVVAYSNDVKLSVLGVPSATIKKYGAVSRLTARAMAEGARRVLNSDIAAAVTGVAGPGGGRPDKPVGLAYIAFSSGRSTKSRKILLTGERAELKERFADALLSFMLENM